MDSAKTLRRSSRSPASLWRNSRKVKLADLANADLMTIEEETSGQVDQVTRLPLPYGKILTALERSMVSKQIEEPDESSSIHRRLCSIRMTLSNK